MSSPNVEAIRARPLSEGWADGRKPSPSPRHGKPSYLEDSLWWIVDVFNIRLELKAAVQGVEVGG